MSYIDVTPTEGQATNPVGTQEPSVGSIPTPNSLLAGASEQMHESALRDENFKSTVTQAVTDMFALKPTWKPNAERVRFVINCPSGQTVLAKHLNTLDLLEAGLIEDLDFFTKRLFPMNDEEGEEDSLWKVLGDIEKRKRFIDVLNRLLAIAIERPKIIDDGIEIATRGQDGSQFLITGSELTFEDNVRVFGRELKPLGENETYASAVDFTDKMAIFGELNKPLSVIKPFRQESLVSLASMESGQSVGDQT